jgi:hypothetical protein
MSSMPADSVSRRLVLSMAPSIVQEAFARAVLRAKT